MASSAREAQHANLSIAAEIRDSGQLSFTATLTDVETTLDQYKDGIVYVNDGTQQGHIYRIASNDAAVAGGTVTIKLHSRTQTTLATSDQVTLIKNSFGGVAITQASLTQRAVGVPPITVPANEFFWAQTFGSVALLQDGTLYEARDVALSRVVHGAISHATVPIAASANDDIQATDNISVVILDAEDNERLADVPVLKGLPATSVVGFSLDPRADTEYSLVQLTIID